MAGGTVDGIISPERNEGGLKRLIRGANPNQRFEDLFHRAKTARLPFDKECWLNIAFFLGEQYVEWGDELTAVRRIERPPNSKHLPRPVANKIQHYVLDLQSDAMQNKPTIDVLPASDDPADISVSRVALSYLNWLFDTNVVDFEEQLSIALLWALAGTESYLKSVWDPSLGPGKAGRGDIMACSPLDVYMDPYAKRFDKCRYVIHSQFMDVEQVYDTYGIEIPPQTVMKTDPVRVALQREMGMAPVLQGATVNELWMPPNRRHKEGLFCTWSGRYTLVEPGAYPYDHGQIPFFQIGSISRPGTQHYTSAVSTLRTPQMELNKFHAQMIQVREAFASPKWWIPTELELESDPNDSPRQILRGISQGGQLEPKLIMPTMMPPNDAGEWIEQEMMDTVGLHDVSQGQAPGRVDSAKGLQTLQQQDEGRLDELMRTIKKAVSGIGWQQLRLAQQFGDETVVFQSYSREGLPESHKLMTAKLDPGMRVRVTLGLGLASSRVERQDQIMALWAQGMLQDPNVALQLLDLPISSVNPDSAFDMKLARNENLEMAAGIAVVPNSWDNHDIHRQEHDNFRKTVDYKMLKSDCKEKFEMHCELHDELQIQQLGRKLQIQSMAAAVAQGVGFQTPQTPGPLPGSNPGAPMPAQQPLQPPGPAGQQRGPTMPGNGGTMPPPPHGAPVGVPNAAGARAPVNVDNVRNTPQGAAHYRDNYASGLQQVR